MKNIFKVLMLLLSVTVSSCAEKSPEVPYNDQVDIYLAGREYKEGKWTTSVWKNGVKQYIENDNDLWRVSSIVASGSDIYIAGITLSGPVIIWKNGIKLYTLNNSFVTAMAVSGNDIYITGVTKTGFEQFTAIVWKNGEIQDLVLSPNMSNSKANSIVISGNDVYVAGSNGSAMLWKNGTQQQLEFSTDMNSLAAGLAVSGNDVFVVGRDDNYEATIWKNGVKQQIDQPLAEMSTADKIAISGNDIYIAGEFISSITTPDRIITKQTAVVWKNGVKQRLNLKQELGSEILSIAILGNDIYAVGNEIEYSKEAPKPSAGITLSKDKYRSVLWKNGVKQSIGIASEDYVIESMLIVKRSK